MGACPESDATMSQNPFTAELIEASRGNAWLILPKRRMALQNRGMLDDHCRLTSKGWETLMPLSNRGQKFSEIVKELRAKYPGYPDSVYRARAGDVAESMQCDYQCHCCDGFDVRAVRIRRMSGCHAGYNQYDGPILNMCRECRKSRAGGFKFVVEE